MTQVTCAISGMKFKVDYFNNLAIPHTEGYFHPIFAAPYIVLHQLYSKHCRGELTSNDSYLLFMAFLHSSDKITWKHPAACNPNEQKTKQLVENNLAQLIEVLEKSAIIKHPRFSQPNFRVTYENCNLHQIPNWIKAWETNIEGFMRGRIRQLYYEDLQQVENKLSKLILSGEDPARFSHIIAEWADRAAEFPKDKADDWKKVIRFSFSPTKMFNTPIAKLKEIKDYCECNIEVGSIHFHTLCTTLKTGITNHIDYLGGATLITDFTLLPAAMKESELKTSSELAMIAEKAPDVEPLKMDYSSSLKFLKAKLAYRVKIGLQAKQIQPIQTR